MLSVSFDPFVYVLKIVLFLMDLFTLKMMKKRKKKR